MLKQRILHKAPARRTPGYFWTLSEKISIPELREKLQDMCAHGAKSLCLHPLPPEFRPDIHIACHDLSPPESPRDSVLHCLPGLSTTLRRV